MEGSSEAIRPTGKCIPDVVLAKRHFTVKDGGTVFQRVAL